MTTVPMSAINQLVLSLYRDGRDLLLHQFQDWALEQVSGVIPFDSACWGNAALEPIKVHWVHLYNCDSSVLEACSPYVPHDFFRAKLMAHPGVSVAMSDLLARGRLARTELYLKVGKAYQVEWSLGTLLVEPMSSLSEYITLWRHDPQRPFTQTERVAKELLMPHLVEAFRAVLLRHFLKERETQRKVWALVDQQGFIREAAPAFSSCLRSHWPDWHGNRLPDELAACVIEGRAFKTKALDIELSQSESLRFLEVKARSSLDRLTARESEIVTRFANGETYSAISTALTLAPATVRNHLSRCYRKLGVNSKAELAKLVANKRPVR
ncbi:response regulator transcription factor [Rhodoferax sp.]|uniref:helix-turn-helix transcriptional regulator n=1 Tax=Rhodoferax sp. TaxID=50421 RepID=UPI00276EE162|nr:helix-turn-helix transcriptional regulator [Rhodoferax sp.]